MLKLLTVQSYIEQILPVKNLSRRPPCPPQSDLKYKRTYALDVFLPDIVLASLAAVVACPSVTLGPA